MWEKTRLPEPLPPAERVMPGRPKSKKRRKEPGEDDGKGKGVKRAKKSNKCSNCGELGHYKRTCKNPTVAPAQSKSKGGRPKKNTAWVKEARQITEKRKATKEAYMRATSSTSNTQHSAALRAANEQSHGTQQSVVEDHELF
ncbi:hypothetical protein KSS87_003080, partial [Heliosperma pusillum]